jgi:hypothetical protein
MTNRQPLPAQVGVEQFQVVRLADDRRSVQRLHIGHRTERSRLNRFPRFRRQFFTIRLRSRQASRI